MEMRFPCYILAAGKFIKFRSAQTFEWAGGRRSPGTWPPLRRSVAPREISSRSQRAPRL